MTMSIRDRHSRQPLTMAETASAHTAQRRACRSCPHGTRATPVLGTTRLTSQLFQR